MIKLCYKEYDYKINLAACKEFFELTGLDLQTVFKKYIVAIAKSSNMGDMERVAYLSEVYTRDVASKALYCMIKQKQDGVSLAEIDDATFRVGWLTSDHDNHMAEPWAAVMVCTAFEINEYFNKSLDIKKTGTSEGQS